MDLDLRPVALGLLVQAADLVETALLPLGVALLEAAAVGPDHEAGGAAGVAELAQVIRFAVAGLALAALGEVGEEVAELAGRQFAQAVQGRLCAGHGCSCLRSLRGARSPPVLTHSRPAGAPPPPHRAPGPRLCRRQLRVPLFFAFFRILARILVAARNRHNPHDPRDPRHRPALRRAQRPSSGGTLAEIRGAKGLPGSRLSSTV